MFVSEVYDARRVRFSPEHLWIPKELSDKKSTICDWRRRCIPKPGFLPPNGLDAADLLFNGALLHTLVSVNAFQNENCFNADGALYPLRLFQESFCWELFSLADEKLKTFIRALLCLLQLAILVLWWMQIGFETHAIQSGPLLAAAQTRQKSLNESVNIQWKLERKMRKTRLFLYFNTTLLLHKRKRTLLRKQNKSELREWEKLMRSSVQTKRHTWAQQINWEQLQFVTYVWSHINPAYSYKKSIQAPVACFAMRPPEKHIASFGNMIRVVTMTVPFLL